MDLFYFFIFKYYFFLILLSFIYFCCEYFVFVFVFLRIFFLLPFQIDFSMQFFHCHYFDSFCELPGKKNFCNLNEDPYHRLNIFFLKEKEIKRKFMWMTNKYLFFFFKVLHPAFTRYISLILFGKRPLIAFPHFLPSLDVSTFLVIEKLVRSQT